MKKFILATVAATLIAAPTLAQAAPQHRGPQQVQTVVKHRPNGTTVVKQKARPAPAQYRGNWRKGERFDARHARNYRQVDYRQVRGLKAPPRGYRYVQSGNDAVLVGITSGIIAAVLANAIR